MSSEEGKIASSFANLDIGMTTQDSAVNPNKLPADEHIDQDMAHQSQPPTPVTKKETEGANASHSGVDGPLSDDDENHYDDDESIHSALKLERNDWEAMRQIPDDKFKDVVLQSVDLSGQLERADVDILSRYRGKLISL